MQSPQHSCEQFCYSLLFVLLLVPTVTQQATYVYQCLDVSSERKGIGSCQLSDKTLLYLKRLPIRVVVNVVTMATVVTIVSTAGGMERDAVPTNGAVVILTLLLGPPPKVTALVPVGALVLGVIASEVAPSAVGVDAADVVCEGALLPVEVTVVNNVTALVSSVVNVFVVEDPTSVVVMDNVCV